VGVFPDLEEQMCTWVPGSGESSDRLDALVWALTSLLPSHPPTLRERLECREVVTDVTLERAENACAVVERARGAPGDT
jgi:hypothetical protein